MGVGSEEDEKVSLDEFKEIIGKAYFQTSGSKKSEFERERENIMRLYLMIVKKREKGEMTIEEAQNLVRNLLLLGAKDG